DDINLQHEINALRTSQRWATLMIVLVILAGLAALVWAVDRYFGGDGVRILLIAAGVAAVIGIIYVMSIVTAAIYGRMAMRHHHRHAQRQHRRQPRAHPGQPDRPAAAPPAHRQPAPASPGPHLGHGRRRPPARRRRRNRRRHPLDRLMSKRGKPGRSKWIIS